MRKLLFIFQFVCFCFFAQAQYSVQNAHSHNDYEQSSPFFLAYNHHFGSIEADIWVVGNELYVAHKENEITQARTLDALYLDPIVKIFKQNGGKAWADLTGSFQLLIDIKSQTGLSMALLVEKLKKHPDVFDPSVNKNAVHVVMTGECPAPADFSKYPAYIGFDGKLNLEYTGPQLERIALYSENLANITSWKGKGQFDEAELTKLKQTIGFVHSLNKKIRFWNAPDTPEAWETLMKLKVDYINTDHIEELSTYLAKDN